MAKENVTNESYEESLKKELANSEDHKVTFSSGKNSTVRKELEAARDQNGYHNIELDKLPSRGLFYPTNTRICFRSLRIDEVKDISSLDESNLIDVYQGLNKIINSCVQVWYSNTRGNYRDLLKCDELYIMFLIRELTYPGVTLPLDIPKGACKTAGCNSEKSIDIRVSETNLESPFDPELMKYYSETERKFVFTTKGGEVFKMKPATIGSHAAAFDYAVEMEKSSTSYDKASLAMMTVFEDWEKMNTQYIEKFATDIIGWPLAKYNLLYNLQTKVEKIGNDLFAHVTCPACGGQMVIPCTFPGNIKELLIPVVSSESDYGLV